MKRARYGFSKDRAFSGQGGFTLLEIIVTIVIAAIMGVFFAQFVYTGVIRSADPVKRVQNLSSATDIMEKMTAQYKLLASSQTNFLMTFKEYVQFGNEYPHPSQRAGYPSWGSYVVLTNKYVLFNAATRVEEDDPDQITGRMLKVTIRCGDQTATSLFTR